jgi:hypothetical protein
VWARVVKKEDGYIFSIVGPHKERTMDVNQERTLLSELLERHEDPIDPAKDDHRHWSVWITEDMLELVHIMGLDVVASLDKADKVGNGVTVLVKVTHNDDLDRACNIKS